MPGQRRTKGMKIYDAARKVLEEVGEPMHYAELTEEMLKRGYWRTLSQTPKVTVYSSLYTHMKKHEDSPFMLVKKSVFGLKSWVSQ